MNHPRHVAGGLAASAVLLMLPAAAHATGSYSVYACKGQTGAVAPAAGWAADRESDAFATNDCATGGPLAVGLTGSGPWQGGIGAEQRFTAPANTRIQSVMLQRKTSGLPGAHGLAYYLLADDKILDSCDPAAAKCNADLDGTLDIPNLDAAVVRFRAGCFESYPDTCTSNGNPLSVSVPQLVVGLKDDVAPTVSNVAGNVPPAGTPAKGTLTVTFDAADAGGGLLHTIVSVDGTPTATNPISSGDCSDATPYKYTAVVPCPLAINGLSAAVDTTKLANGPHAIDIVVEDAAGNRTAVIPTATLTVANPVPKPVPVTPASINGINGDVQGRLTAYFVASRTQSLRNRFGNRVVVRGVLVNRHGRGIQGARLDVYHQVSGGKRHTLIKTGLKTRQDGKYTLILPLDLTTRSVTIAYRAQRPGKITSQQVLHLTVVSKHGNVIHQRPAKHAGR